MDENGSNPWSINETLPPWWGLVGVGQKFDGEAGIVCIKGDASTHTPDACVAPVAILGLSFDVIVVASCVVLGLYPDLQQRDVRHFRPGTWRLDGLSSWNPEAGWTCVLEPGGWLNFCPKPDGCVDLQGDLLVYLFYWKSPPSSRLKDGTRRVRFVTWSIGMHHIPPSVERLLVNFSQEIAGLSYVPRDSIAGSWDLTEPLYCFRTRQCCWDPKAVFGARRLP
ncbi:hypothetical protein HID58_060105 [Brassica napus]|uniref:Uncharacterized protein n=1 Tax=Brassica napus TaxID=3708 RepID=A0ABQ7ZUS8_BRANA|nr:hypothetical protein HID58_060105 [Brassica napus]